MILFTLVISLFLTLTRSIDVGDIEFLLHGIPSTWEGFPNGMVEPRDSPTSELPFEFDGKASNMSYSVVTHDTIAGNEDGISLSSFDGYVLDLWIRHSNGLWPCVSAEPSPAHNLRIKKYDSNGHNYLVQSDYVMNSSGEYFFNSTLFIVD